MTDLKYITVPKEQMRWEMGIVLIIGMLIGTIVGTQGAFYVQRYEARELQEYRAAEALKDRHSASEYNASMDHNAPAEAKKAARNYVRRVAP